jgi:Fe-S cluster assembly protein SufD
MSNTADTFAAKGTFAALFAQTATYQAGQPAWLRSLHSSALDAFSTLGLPTRSDEEWRFTSPGRISESTFRLSEAVTDTPEASTLSELVWERLTDDTAPTGYVVCNGRVLTGVGGLSSPAAPAVTGRVAELGDDSQNPIAEKVRAALGSRIALDQNGMAALNAAFFEDAIYLYIPRGAVIEKPIELVFVSGSPAERGTDALLNAPRLLIVAEENSQATILETYISSYPGAFTCAVTEVIAGDNAIVDHYKVTDENADALHVAQMGVQLGTGTVFSSHSVTLGGGFVRNEVTARLDGEHAECTLNGLYLGDGDRLVDNHTTIDHASPNCSSHELYKGILADKSRGVFNGKIFVRLDAQKTDAKQTNKALLLSPDARVDTKPQLEILADDVKCTHGATIGQLEPNQVFYLRSRGISETDARSLLTYAFAGDVVQRIKVAALKSALDKRILELLPGSVGL